MKTIKLSAGHYLYRGYEIERMESGIWCMRPSNVGFFTDAADTLKDAKADIDRWAASSHKAIKSL